MLPITVAIALVTICAFHEPKSVDEILLSYYCYRALCT